MEWKTLKWVALAVGIGLSLNCYSTIRQFRENLEQKTMLGFDGDIFRFKIDEDWARKNRYGRQYGIIYYYDEDGDGRPGFNEKIFKIFPKGYPFSLIKEPYDSGKNER